MDSMARRADREPPAVPGVARWRSAAILFAALVIVDLASIAYAARPLDLAPTAGGMLPLVTPSLSSMSFWAAFWVLLRISATWTAQASSRALSPVVQIVTLAIATAVIEYHLVLWSYVWVNARAPTAEVMSFLRENISRIPAHVLQTAPLLAVGVTLVAGTVALGVMWSLRRLPTASRDNIWRRDAATAAVLLLSWQLLSHAAGNHGPSVAELAGQAPEVDPALVKAQLDALPARRDVAPHAGAAGGHPVIVILVESLRHDLLETNPEAIPFIRSLYRQNVGFSRAYATASHSDLTDLAFWFSQYPLKGADKEGFPPDADWRGPSLFDLFKAYGYRTAYISSQNELWGGMINWLKTPSVDYYFDSESYAGQTWENFDDVAGLAGMIKRGITQAGKVEDSETLRIAEQWIRSLGGSRSFFLGMNLQNTHFSYVLSPGAARPYEPSNLDFRAVYYSWPRSQAPRVKNRYLNSVHDVDNLLASFAAFLMDHDLWDDCLFVVVGDNGEAFYEHGFGNHSGPMYDEVVRTLAFMKLPASYPKAHGPISRPVSHIDIAATVADVSGLPLPWSFQGRSVLSDSCIGRPVFMYSNAIVRQIGVVQWPWKYLRTEAPAPTEELYDLAADPREKQNLSRARPDEVTRLKEVLFDWSAVQRYYYSTDAYLRSARPDYCDAEFSGLQEQPDREAVFGAQPRLGFNRR